MDFRVTCNADKEAVREYVARLPEGKAYRVHIALEKKKRSLSQNRLYHLYLNCIARETGNDIDDLHRYYAATFLGVQLKEVFGARVKQPVSTATLSTDAFGEYLDKIIAHAAGEGIVLPDPTDRYFEQFYDKYNEGYDR